MLTVQGYFIRYMPPQGRSEANEMRFHHSFVDFDVVFEMIIEKTDFHTQNHNGENFSPIKIEGKIFPHPKFSGKIFPISGETKYNAKFL